LKYIRLSIVTTSEFSPIVADRLFTLGSLGVAIADPNDLKEVIDKKKYWDYIDESAYSFDPHTVVTGFFEADVKMEPILNAINELKDNEYFEVGSLETSYRLEDSAEYEDAWKQYYNPIEIGAVTIIPKWVPFDTSKTIPVILDPGTAFGTGSHETTSLCIELLQSVSDIAYKTVLDMGCGSGILGIAALKLGAKKAAFVDIDPIATKSALDNSSLNYVQDKGVYVTVGFNSVGKQLGEVYDVILANLTADMLIDFYPHVKKLLKKGGCMIVSGIISSRLQEVVDLYSKSFGILESRVKNDWCGLLLLDKDSKVGK